METRILAKSFLDRWFKAIQAEGRRILAPVDHDGRILVEAVQSPADLAKGYLQARMSAKHAVFPRCEEVLRFSEKGGETTLNTRIPTAQPTVVFGVRPCEATGFGVQEAVFNWDTPDGFFTEKMSKLTVVGLACAQADEYCFCTSVEGAPGHTRGSDILLTDVGGDRYLAEIVTDKGAALAALAAEGFTPAPPGLEKGPHLARVPARFSLAELKEKLPGKFDDPVWDAMALRCLGCGACAYVCPACTCFDVQDEKAGDGGRRLRGWDSCGFAQFTLHASGHNPREVQGERWRQRLMHKFAYQPERQGVLGCTGCGKCSRACPVDMNIREHLSQLAEVVE